MSESVAMSPPQVIGHDTRNVPGIGSVAVIGGGISGLAAAFFLLRSGAAVTLYEASDRFGGLGTTFAHRDLYLDCFYHVLLPTDDDLLALCEEIGVADGVYWREASLGFLYQGRTYPLAGPLDLLRFGALPLIDRLRLGWTALYAAHIARPGPLDDITAKVWLERLAGRRAFDRLLGPLLKAKFGSGYDRIPALWYWASFNREKGTGKEMKGYLRGGYKGITDALVSDLRGKGARLHLSTPVDALKLDATGRPVVETAGQRATFDRLISTVPLVRLRQVCGDGELGERIASIDPGIDYQGVVNVLLLLDRSLSDHYWIPVVDSAAPFQGIVETTRVIDRSETGNHHLVYLLSYVHRTDPLFRRDDKIVIDEYTSALLRLFPELPADAILERFVFRAPFVEPLYTAGYGRRKPSAEVLEGRFYLATTAQAYPGVTSWNQSTEIAREAVAKLVGSVEAVQ